MNGRLHDFASESPVLRTVHSFTSPHAWRPSLVAAAARGPGDPLPRGAHLKAAMQWIARAQDAVAGGGVSAMYTIRKGWLPPYPETTGYILVTCLDHARLNADPSFTTRACRMADWLVRLQRADGSFPGGILEDVNQPPVVFDVGQITQGLVAAHAETRDPRYLDAARRAGDWLLAVQDPDGAWRRFEYEDTPHTYEARTGWALAALSRATGDTRYARAALSHASWTLERQHANGWFADTGFRKEDVPFTHTIAYTLEGLLETGVLLDEKPLVDAARRGADALLERYEAAPRWGAAPAGLIPGRLDAAWTSRDRWACLTGCAQIARVWLRLAETDGDDRYAAAASRLLDALAGVHDVRSRAPDVNGALAGSYPQSGAYLSYTYPNWAAKFLADALLLEARVFDRPPVVSAAGDGSRM